MSVAIGRFKTFFIALQPIARTMQSQCPACLLLSSAPKELHVKHNPYLLPKELFVIDTAELSDRLAIGKMKYMILMLDWGSRKVWGRLIERKSSANVLNFLKDAFFVPSNRPF